MCVWHGKKIHKSVVQICMVRSTLGTTASIPRAFAFTRFFSFFFSAITQASAEYIFSPAVAKQRADGGSRFK